MAQDGREVLLDEVGLAFFHDEHGALAFAEADDFALDDGIGHVHHIQRHAGLAVHVGQAQAFERTQQRVVAAALHDDADVVGVFGEELVELALLDEAHGGGPAVLHLLLFMHEARGRQHDAADVALRVLQRFLQRELGALVVAGDEVAVHMAGADAQLEHHGRVAGLREVEAGLHRIDDARQVGPRIEQPDLRLHGERMAALLHDRRALAVVFAHDDERATGDAARGQVGQRIGRHVGAHGRLEGDGAAQRVVDGGGQRGSGGGFAGAVLEADAVVGQDVLRVGQHIHQVRDRSALVARHIRHARLQQGLGDGQNAFAAEHFSTSKSQLLDFFDERTLSHGCPSSFSWEDAAPGSHHGSYNV
ncbi:hypothetical protein D9M69_478070 [compost metagenome]